MEAGGDGADAMPGRTVPSRLSCTAAGSVVGANGWFCSVIGLASDWRQVTAIGSFANSALLGITCMSGWWWERVFRSSFVSFMFRSRS
mmetsp:Transcript_81433/g.218963  ORF Transcript_81433/g.218963 Transcript_81433/m.218963 type:complete len:88 (-) Transcript_81433:1019-1282(-)